MADIRLGIGPLIYIGGEDRTNYLAINSGRISRDLNGIATFNGTLRQLRRDFTPVKRQEILIEQSTIRRFAGSIFSIDKKDAGGSVNLMEFDLECVDYNHILARRATNVIIPAGTSLYTAVSSIALTSLNGEGVSLTGVDNPGPTIDEELDFSDYQYVKYAFDRISTVTGHMFYIDFFKVLHFSAFQPNDAPFELRDGTGNYRNLRVKTSDEYYVNRQYIRTEHSL